MKNYRIELNGEHSSIYRTDREPNGTTVFAKLSEAKAALSSYLDRRIDDLKSVKKSVKGITESMLS